MNEARRQIRRTVVTLASVAVGVLATAPASQAQRTWAAPFTIGKNGSQSLAGVSCPTASQCTAVDGAGQQVTFAPGTTTPPTPVNIDEGHPLIAVSCASAAQCTAVGEAGEEVTFDPVSPTSPASTQATIDPGQVLTGVACPADGECLAVDGDGEAIAFDPASPSGKVAKPIDGQQALAGVSCPSGGPCVAVDSAGDEVQVTVTTSPLALSATEPTPFATAPIDIEGVACPSAGECVATAYDGTPSAIAFDPAAPGPPAPQSLGSGFPGPLACSSSSLCAAELGGDVATFDPGTPTTAATDTDLDGNDTLTAIDCQAGGNCTAVDESGQQVSFDPTDPSGSPTTIDGSTGLNAIACPADNQCTAVDGVNQQYTFDPLGPSSPTPTSFVDGASLITVACPLSNQCTEVDDEGNESTFAPTTPATPATIQQTGILYADEIAIACASGELCTLAASDGQEESFDPESSPPTFSPNTIDNGNALAAIACPSSGQCTAVDDRGNAVTFDPSSSGTPATTITPIDGGSPLTGIACPTTGQCTAVDQDGNAVTFPPGGTAAPTVTDIDGSTPLTGIACPTSTDCIAVDASGNAIEGSPTAPTSWTSQAIAGGYALTGVNCSEIEQCAAVDVDGQAIDGTPTPTSTPFVPANVTPPWISGAPIEGDVLTEHHGTWLPTPTGYTYLWVRCNAAFPECESTGATGPTYTLTAADVGSTMEVLETAIDAAGASGYTRSAPTAVVTAPAPITVGFGSLVRSSVSGDVASVVLACTGPSTVHCALTAKLTLVETRKKGKVIAVSAKTTKTTKRTLTVAQENKTLSGGRRLTVHLRLDATARHLLSSRHRLSTELTVNQHVGSRTGTLGRRTLVFTSPRRKRR
ncbi:MAG TPA: hypothetical protein VHX88_15500 [Solirubrobacteraceae bacterium]|nr:hypothetical protein [Solirubrobacteraceae bacterium]